MSRILVVALNSQFAHSNLALRYFRQNSGCDICEFSINDNIFETYAKLCSLKYEIFCFSVYIWNIEYIKKLVPMIKNVRSDIKIVFGGPEAGFNAENMLYLADGIIKGEGEEAICELEAGKPICDVCGMVYLKNGQVQENEVRLPDLSKIKFPYTDEDAVALKNKLVYFETSRGCMYGCTYCLSSACGKTRYFDLDYVYNGIDYFIKHNFPIVKLVDRTFNENDDRACAIAEYIAKNSRSTVFHMEISPMRLTKRFCDICGKSGGKVQFEIGIQTTNPDTMKAIRRIYNKEDVKAKIAMISADVHTHMDLIAGLPYETYQSFKDGFNYVYDMHPDMLQLGFLKLLHNTVLKSEAQDYGIKTTDFPPYEVLKTNTLPAEDIIKLKRIESVVDRVYNSGKFKRTLEFIECDDMFCVFEKISDRLYEEEKTAPVSREGLYKIILELFPATRPHLAADYMESGAKLKLPDFLDDNPSPTHLKKLRKRLAPQFGSARLNIFVSGGKTFVRYENKVTEVNMNKITEILLATNNQGKVKEMKKILEPLGIEVYSLKDKNISIEVVEDGTTFEENALKKAREICELSGLVTVSDDSGLMVDALGGAPGVYSARYAGENSTDEEKYLKLLSELENVDDENRGAKFVSAVALCFPDGEHKIFVGECHGVITRTPDGNGGFGYDPVFFVPEEGKTFSSMSADLKNSISHRAKALKKLKDYLV